MPDVPANSYRLVRLGAVPGLFISDTESPVSWGARVVHVSTVDASACSTADRAALVQSLPDPGDPAVWRNLYVLDWQNLDWYMREPQTWPAAARPLVACGKRPSEAAVLAALSAGLDGYMPEQVPEEDIGRLVKQLFRS